MCLIYPKPDIAVSVTVYARVTLIFESAIPESAVLLYYEKNNYRYYLYVLSVECNNNVS